MKLIVGLGNPGKEYEKTRHNAGFMALDKLADKLGVSVTTAKWNALIAVTRIEGQAVVLMKPLTYMNLSGSAVSQAVQFYKIENCDILVMHDDMDLPVGSLRIRKKGSSGGQKGMESILSSLQTKDINRIRIGVGRDKTRDHDEVPDWVLSPIPKAEQEACNAAITGASLAAYAWVHEPMDIVMSKFNMKVKEG